MTEVKSTQLEDASIQELVDKARTAQKEYELFLYVEKTFAEFGQFAQKLSNLGISISFWFLLNIIFSIASSIIISCLHYPEGEIHLRKLTEKSETQFIVKNNN